MDPFIQNIIVFPLIAVVLLSLFLYTFYAYRRGNAQKLGMPTTTGDGTFEGGAFGYAFGQSHPMLIAFIFALCGAGLLFVNAHFAGAGFILFGVAMIIGRLLIQYVPGYKKESFLSQAVFLLITLVAVCLVGYEILLLQLSQG